MATAVSIEAKIILALTQAFQAVTLPAGCGVAAPNVTFTPDGVHPYVRVIIAKNQPINASLSGTREPVRQGLLSMTVCWPLNTGLLPASELAAQLRDAFKFNTRIPFVGGYITVYKEPAVQSDMKVDNYCEIPVIVPWRVFTET